MPSRTLAILLALLILCSNSQAQQVESSSSQSHRAIEGYLKRLEVYYEKKFERPAPQFENYPIENLSDKKYEEFLQKRCRFLGWAIGIGLPYKTKEEDTAIKNKSKEIEILYKKMFGKAITELELSTEQIVFKLSTFGSMDDQYYLLVARTATGIIARCKPTGTSKFLEAKLSTKEWLDFIRTLYKSVNEWHRFYNGPGLGGEQWGLNIRHLDKDLDVYMMEKDEYRFGGSNAYPTNWNEFIKFMDTMEAKIRNYNLEIKPCSLEKLLK